MSTHDSNLTLDELKRVLGYNPATGIFVWKVTRNNRLKAGDVAGSIRKSGYINLGVCDNLFLAHRLAWFYVYGEWPSGELDHINRDRSDNRIENLREVSRAQNCQNSILSSRNTSGYKGVAFDRRKGLWHARIHSQKKTKSLGYWERVEDAANAYARAASEIHTHNPMARSK